MEGLCSLLFKNENGINQYAGQKTFNRCFGASVLLLEFSCFRNIVLPCHLRMLFGVYTGKYYLLSEIISLVFCSVLKKSTLLNIK